MEGEGGEEEGKEGLINPITPEMAIVESRIRLIGAEIGYNGLLAKWQAGYYNGKIQGIAAGLFIMLVFIGILML